MAQKVVTDNNSSKIPEYVYESLARSLLPVIQKYYESEEGKDAYAEWKAKRTKTQNDDMK